MPDARIHPAKRSSSKGFWWAVAKGVTPVPADDLEPECYPADAYSPDPYSPDPYTML
jgi:hypothetical protein